MEATHNRFFLRLLMVLLVATVGATVAAGPYFHDTLPAPLAAFINASDDTNLTTPQVITFLIGLVSIVAGVVGMTGLWWCRRWARWVFTIPVLTWPVLGGVLAFVDPTLLISNFIQIGFNTAADMVNGAILALIWLGMSADFNR
jgi:hypothetical protein